MISWKKKLKYILKTRQMHFVTKEGVTPFQNIAQMANRKILILRFRKEFGHTRNSLPNNLSWLLMHALDFLKCRVRLKESL